MLKPYLTKFGTFFKAVKFHGGIWGSLKHSFITDELKVGQLVGEDKFGNKYYKDDYHFVGRNRWVTYAPNVFLDYDGSQIPPEWHRWLHHMTDDPPSEKPLTPRKWMVEHKENMTGTDDIYVPYSTTRSKIESWKPPKAS